MQRKMRARLGAGLASALVLAALGCQTPSAVQAPRGVLYAGRVVQLQSNADLAIVLDASKIFGKKGSRQLQQVTLGPISYFIIKVTGANLAAPIERRITEYNCDENGLATFELTGLPPGPVTVVANAFDAADQLVSYASAPATVVANNLTVVDMQCSNDFGRLTIRFDCDGLSCPPLQNSPANLSGFADWYYGHDNDLAGNTYVQGEPLDASKKTQDICLYKVEGGGDFNGISYISENPHNMSGKVYDYSLDFKLSAGRVFYSAQVSRHPALEIWAPPVSGSTPVLSQVETVCENQFEHKSNVASGRNGDIFQIVGTSDRNMYIMKFNEEMDGSPYKTTGEGGYSCNLSAQFYYRRDLSPLRSGSNGYIRSNQAIYDTRTDKVVWTSYDGIYQTPADLSNSTPDFLLEPQDQGVVNNAYSDLEPFWYGIVGRPNDSRAYLLTRNNSTKLFSWDPSASAAPVAILDLGGQGIDVQRMGANAVTVAVLGSAPSSRGGYLGANFTTPNAYDSTPHMVGPYRILRIDFSAQSDLVSTRTVVVVN